MESSSPDALQVFAAWVSAREGDDRSEFEELLRLHPDLAAELKEVHDTWRQLVAAGAEASHPPTSTPTAAPHGERLGRYGIEGEIARGGMGSILRAWDADLQRHLAVKVSLESDRARTLSRFIEEARITGQLDHPGIVPVHELGLDSSGRTFFTMKLVEGRDLRRVFEDVFKGRNGWNETRALGVLLKACEALAYAHKKGIIHRDLKPANVMVGSFGEVFVMDWGLARALAREDLHDLRVVTDRSKEKGQSDSPLVTMDGDVLGTPAYMPPEQARGEIEKLSPRSDVYSLGAMLYHLLVRRMPYEESAWASDSRRVLARVRAGPPDPIHRLNPSVPAELAAICEKAMAREMADRYADTLALAEDLRSYLEHRVVAAYETGALAELRKWIQRNKPLAAAMAAALVLAIVGLTWVSIVQTRAREAIGKKNVDLAAATKVAQASEQLATQKANDVLSLSAIQDLKELEDRADALWPADPENVPKYEAWLSDARFLIEGRPADPAKGWKARPSFAEHEAKLAEIRQRARPLTPERIEVDRTETAAQLAERVPDTYEFEDAEDRWWHAQLSKLVLDLEAFTDEEQGGLFSAGVSEIRGWGVVKRFEFARTIQERSVDGPEAKRRWIDAVAAIEKSPWYGGLTLVPQLGLLPIGEDPDSQLWEFAHLATGEPAERGADRKLVVKEEMGLVLVLIPGGTFAMGAQSADSAAPNYDPQAMDTESPVHEVTLSPYFLSKYEMTQSQWLGFTGRNPSTYRMGGLLGGYLIHGLHPVEQVTWGECVEVLRRLDLCLPTEAQWESAARGGTDTPWWTGADRESLRGQANLADQSAARAGGTWPELKDWPDLDDGWAAHAPIGRYPPNAFGLHDVHGNVWEWCMDGFGARYPDTPQVDPGAPWEGSHNRVFRGGSFSNSAASARVAYRNGDTLEYQGLTLGLRPARRIAK